jgi:hypothetical protein
MDSTPLVIIDDNLIHSIELRDYIEHLCLIPRMFEYAGEASGVSQDYNPMFVHFLKRDREITSELFFLFAPLVSLMLSKHGLQFNSPDNIFRQRLFFQPASVRNKDYVHDPNLHIDLHNYPHYNLIYYVNDSDGGTWLYDKMDYNQTNYKLVKFIEHKKGRMVLFDGKYFHAGSKPTNSTRIVVNTNILKNF